MAMPCSRDLLQLRTLCTGAADDSEEQECQPEARRHGGVGGPCVSRISAGGGSDAGLRRWRVREWNQRVGVWSLLA